MNLKTRKPEISRFHILFALLLLLCGATAALAQNVNVTNPASRPVPVTIVSGGAGSGGDASAANQTAVQATAGSDATKAVAVQGITGGKAVPVSAATLPLPTGASTATNQTTTNTSLASIDTKTPAAPATAGNQSAGNTSLASIDGKMAGDTTNGSKVQVQVSKGAANFANGQVASSTTAATLAAARATRRAVTIKNMDAAITVYVGAATVTSANGMPIKAGESIRLETTALVQVISASGTPNIAYVETYD